MSGFALDSNIVSFYLKHNEKVQWNVDRALELNNAIIIPPFAYYEVKRGLEAINAKKLLREFEAFCARLQVGKLDDSLLERAIPIYVELQHKGRPCDDNDIYIAAFCQTYGLTLVTNNTRHFEHIPGLALADWSVGQGA
jgi:predicted nucleic acid-binding protein